jgi:hypothetical protein
MKKCVNNFVVLTYKSLPETEFICDYKGEIRIKVSKIKEKLTILLSSKRMYAMTDHCLYLFDDVGSKVRSLTDFVPAIEWYKMYCNEQDMRLVIPEA